MVIFKEKPTTKIELCRILSESGLTPDMILRQDFTNDEVAAERALMEIFTTELISLIPTADLKMIIEVFPDSGISQQSKLMMELRHNPQETLSYLLRQRSRTSGMF